MTDNERCIQLLEEIILLQKKVDTLTGALEKLSTHKEHTYNGERVWTVTKGEFVSRTAKEALAEVGKK